MDPGRSRQDRRQALVVAGILAEEAFAGGMITTKDDARIASQSCVRESVRKGFLKDARSCGTFLICSADSLLFARADKGQISHCLAEASRMRRFFCGNESCPKSDVPVVITEDDPCLATCSRWTEDTASVKIRG